MSDYAIVKCTRCGKDRWDGPAPVCWPCQEAHERIVRDNYLPANRGTGCKSCRVWSPVQLSREEFARLPHEADCPIERRTRPTAGSSRGEATE